MLIIVVVVVVCVNRNVAGNKISRFEAVFPRLTTLYIGNNNLTSIPSAIFKHDKLSALYMDNNPMSNVSLSNTQANFLSALTNFTIDAADLNVNCNRGQQRVMHELTFCVFADDLISSSAPAPSATTISTKGSSSNVGLIVGVGIGAVVLVLVMGYLLFWVRKLRNNSKANGTSTGTTGGTGSTAFGGDDDTSFRSLWQDRELLALQLRSEDIEDIETIGRGAFATVWLVRYRESQLLASKRLTADGATRRQQTRQFVEEIKIVSNLQYPKIVQFIGAAWTVEIDLQALFEYMEGGDLRALLESTQLPRTWTPEKVQIAIDIVEALVYVHSFSPPLLHRDLKSRNVLLSGTFEAKLTDFGVSRFQSEQNTMTAGVGTARWLAPEVITGQKDYGTAADIFSLGAVLTELDTHELPYEDAVGPYGNRLGDVALYQMVSTGQVRPNFSVSCPTKIVELGRRCLSLNPSARPNAAEMAYELRSFKKRMMVQL